MIEGFRRSAHPDSQGSQEAAPVRLDITYGILSRLPEKEKAALYELLPAGPHHKGSDSHTHFINSLFDTNEMFAMSDQIVAYLSLDEGEERNRVKAELTEKIQTIADTNSEKITEKFNKRISDAR